jgi:peptide/nickel transport system permease protein
VLQVIGKRLLMLIPTLIGLSILLFVWVRNLPGGPATALLGDKATPDAVAAINAAYGFDRPLIEQYFTYVGKLLRGDFGTSIVTGRPVLEEFATRFPATLELAVVALIFAIGIGIPLGYLAATHYGRFWDHSSVVLSLLGITVPVFFLAFILKWLLAIQLPVFPPDGRQDPRIDATHVTDFYVLDGLLTREWDASWDAVMHLVLPGIALGTIPLAIIVRITRASVLEVQGADYVRHASRDHDHWPADRPADLRRGADRNRLRLQRRGAVPSRRHFQPGLSGPAGIHHFHRHSVFTDQPDR